ncbi:cytochrome c3 family protein [candidate division KSB1 bacterium]
MNRKTLILIVISVFLLYGLTIPVSESNYVCSSCHSDKHDQWDQSTHLSINCCDCHVEEGYPGTFKAQVKGIRNIFIAATKGVNISPHEDPVPLPINNCKKCHAAILLITELMYPDSLKEVRLGQGLIINHSLHIEKYEMKCVDCHRKIIHFDPMERENYNSEKAYLHLRCLPCHDGEYWERFQIEVTSIKNMMKCNICHLY